MQLPDDLSFREQSMKLASRILTTLCIAAVAGQTLARSTVCPDRIPGPFGPFDYTDTASWPDPGALRLVETYHFTPDVERLIKGASTSLPGADLDYTLIHFPNHHRALDAASKLSLREKASKPTQMSCTVVGYFERAVRFAPNDGKLRIAYGMHYYRHGDSKHALD